MSGSRSLMLTYHSLDDSGSVISTAPGQFRWQMEFLVASGVPAVGTSLQFLSTRSNRLDLQRIDTYYLRSRFPLERLSTVSGSLYIGFRRLLRDVRGFVFR